MRSICERRDVALSAQKCIKVESKVVMREEVFRAWWWSAILAAREGRRIGWFFDQYYYN